MPTVMFALWSCHKEKILNVYLFVQFNFASKKNNSTFSMDCKNSNFLKTKYNTRVFLLREQVVLSKQGGFFMKFAETSRLY